MGHVRPLPRRVLWRATDWKGIPRPGVLFHADHRRPDRRTQGLLESCDVRPTGQNLENSRSNPLSSQGHHFRAAVTVASTNIIRYVSIDRAYKSEFTPRYGEHRRL